MHTFTIPGGKEKGTPVNQASVSTLNYWIERISSTLQRGESPNARYDQGLLAAMRAALAVGPGERQRSAANTQTRNRASAASEPAPERAAGAALQKLTGAFNTTEEVMTMLRDAARVAHLVSPQTSCGQLPVGCCIASCVVWIDPDTETYEIAGKGDKRGLDKSALEKIGNAAGLSWDPVLTCRLDNGSNPHYCHFRAVGYVRNFDGTVRTEVGSVEMDLRDGSQTAIETEERALKNKKDNTELALMRKFILRHAESKAMNRVVRKLGVRTSYQRHELENKPFVVTTIMFTGQTHDPELKKMFAEKTFEAFHGGSRVLYAPAPTQALSAGHAPPSLGASSLAAPDADEDDLVGDPDDFGDDPYAEDYHGDDGTIDADGESVEPSVAADGGATPPPPKRTSNRPPASQQELKT